MAIDRNAPHWRRPRIFDPRIGERFYFWNELTHAERFEELNYCAYKNRELATYLKGEKPNGNT